MKAIPVRSITTAHKESGSSPVFTIRDVRQLLGGDDLTQELHRHDFYFILALEHGKGTHEIDFTPHTISDRSMYVMRPGQVHQLSLKKGCTGYLLEFNTSFYQPSHTVSRHRLKRAAHKNVCTLQPDRFKRVLTLLKRMFQEYKERQEGYQEVIIAELDVLFIELTRQSRNLKSSSDNASQYRKDRLEEFFELLETHVFRHKEVSHYAELMHLSPFQLNAITKASLGKTSSTLICERIILESRRYLLATSNQISEIAYHLGFEDVSYYIRFFRKHTGYSPEAYRERFR